MIRYLVPHIESKLVRLQSPLSVQLPQGQTLGPKDAPVKMSLSAWSSLARLKAGEIGALGEEFVEGTLNLEGHMRDIMRLALDLLPGSPVASTETGRVARTLRRWRSMAAHTPDKDARQIEFHYDVSDDFYALWLDPRRVYSCAYFRDDAMTLQQAQEAKLDLICRKLMLRPGERFLDMGAGWGGLLLWAAEHYSVDATGITLSRNQHAHVERLIASKGLQHRVRMQLCDYRDLGDNQRFDKIASVGMFEHVGVANLPTYFGKIRSLLEPGGLVMNHGITAGGTDNQQLGAGMGRFIGKYIFPGGELVHVGEVISQMARAGLEMVDTENLRPHYARTLWAWSDMLEERLDDARRVLTQSAGSERAEKILRAYRLYLAGSALGFEQGWISLHQILASSPAEHETASQAPTRARSSYPFSREYMYC